MTTIHDLRQVAEAMPHSRRPWCLSREYNIPEYAEKNCNCPRATLLTTLDAAEKHLREMVLGRLRDSMVVSGINAHYAASDKALAALNAFLNPKDETDD